MLTPEPPSITFRAAGRQEVAPMTVAQLTEFAADIGLSVVAPNRISSLFVFDIYVHSVINGIDPAMIVAEVRALESGDVSVGTKAASQFTYLPLKGLWHKHFFSAHFIPQNISNYYVGGKLESTVERVLDTFADPAAAPEQTRALIQQLVTRPILERDAENKLTGEWIIFAKHNGQNFYLTSATHSKNRVGDLDIKKRSSAMLAGSFPF